MGFFDIFKKQLIHYDDTFGELRYFDLKSKGYFEGKGYFAPTNVQTEYIIESDKSGPTNEQKHFYTDLQLHFNDYIQKIKPLIESKFSSWRKDFKIIDFNKEFTIIFLTIPNLNLTPVEWDISFKYVNDENHNTTIYFLDKEPTEISVDG